MSLDQQDIENIAVLARLRLDKSEIPEITQRITAILSMVDQMQSVDTKQTTSPQPLSLILSAP